jgi:hypothetical protein
MNRLAIIIYIVFCFELGVFLLVFPWKDLWTRNFFFSHYPSIAGFMHNYFVRGAVSGLGLADVWLAFFEVWRFRHELGIVRK